MNTKNKAIVASLMTLVVLTAMIGTVSARTNTIASSTMIFQSTSANGGTLTEINGEYNGTAPMINELTLGIGDSEAGFDLYAKNGAKATYDKAGSGSQDYACGVVATHDAYTTTGGWGLTYDPDCADWDNYQLRFNAAEDKWYLEYNANVGNDHNTAGALAPPMSGTMDWTKMYATETGVGAYYSSMGTPESDGYALCNPCTCPNSGTQAWDMDWSWGSDFVPLEHPGFTVTVTDLGGNPTEYQVTLTPSAVAGVGSEAVVDNVAPYVCEKWEACPDAVNTRVSSFVPNLGNTRTVAIVACVCDGNGNDDITSVTATVDGPDSTHYDVANFNPDNTVTCTEMNCNYGLPCTGYSGTVDMGDCDPSGAYTVVVTVTDTGSEIGTKTNEFEYLSIVGLDLDFTTVSFGDISPGSTSSVTGDAIFGGDAPTIRNLGNDDMDVTVSIEQVSGPEPLFEGNTKAKLDVVELSILATTPAVTTFDINLGCGLTTNADFELSVPVGTLPGSYVATITFDGYKST